MPVLLVECVLCGLLVSKRSTLSLETLGAGSGRACRTHGEIAELKAEACGQSRQSYAFREVRERMNIVSFAVVIRLLCSLYAYTPEYVIARLRTMFPADGELVGRVELQTRHTPPITANTKLSLSQLSLAWLIQGHIERTRR
jgi:hypothetical protein